MRSAQFIVSINCFSVPAECKRPRGYAETDEKQGGGEQGEDET